jgi:chlorite dismutase
MKTTKHEPEAPAGSPANGHPAAAPARKRTVDLDPSGQVSGREPDRVKRQFLNYAFYKLDPAFRRLPQAEKEAAKREFATVMEGWEGQGIILRTYSLVGLRSEVDFMLWRIAFDVREFQAIQAKQNRTVLGAYLTQPYNFVSMQKRSQYVNRIEGSGEDVELLPGQGQYLFVYPFIKTRAWYDLTPHARQGMMDEHIHASLPFKGVRINTSYSYGIDDQEFVVSFDSDFPQEFVDLVHRLRYTEASMFTLRDTPMFTCVKKELREILDELA